MKDKPKRNFKKHLAAGVCFLLSAAVILLAAFFPAEKKEVEAEKRIVRVWNVDTFEGGRGSRTAFLKSAARRVEKKRSGVYYLIGSYTAEGAEAAFAEGKAPDVLSFGVGLSAYLERSQPLPYSFPGGEVGGKTLAYPWCKGGYALFSKSDDFQEEGKTAISCGGSNLAEAAAFLSGVRGEAMSSDLAYTKFLSGEYRYLLGTQRDLCRFKTRGENVFYRPLPAFCDLYQYFSVLSTEKRDDCLALLDELLASGEKLGEIGMYPAEEDGDFAEKPASTVGVFSSREALGEILQAARQGDEKNLRKFLKTV